MLSYTVCVGQVLSLCRLLLCRGYDGSVCKLVFLPYVCFTASMNVMDVCNPSHVTFLRNNRDRPGRAATV